MESIKLELRTDCKPLGASADAGSVWVDAALVENLYEVSVANAVIHMHRPPGIDGRQLVENYQRNLAQSRGAARLGEPCPRPATIFEMLGERAPGLQQAQSDPQFWNS